MKLSLQNELFYYFIQFLQIISSKFLFLFN